MDKNEMELWIKMVFKIKKGKKKKGIRMCGRGGRGGGLHARENLTGTTQLGSTTSCRPSSVDALYQTPIAVHARIGARVPPHS